MSKSRGLTGRVILYHLTGYRLVWSGMALEQRFSAFFYGTLLHPKILKRVIGNDGSHLEICPAVLLVSPATTRSTKQGEQNLTVTDQIGSHEA